MGSNADSTGEVSNASAKLLIHLANKFLPITLVFINLSRDAFYSSKVEDTVTLQKVKPYLRAFMAVGILIRQPGG